jgi:hypothetical protein
MFRIRDPGIEKTDLGSGMKIPDIIFENIVPVFWDKNT